MLVESMIRGHGGRRHPRRHLLDRTCRRLRTLCGRAAVWWGRCSAILYQGTYESTRREVGHMKAEPPSPQPPRLCLGVLNTSL
jgi:hypothetical protein